MTEVIRFRKLNAAAKTPVRAHTADAGWDVTTTEMCVLHPGQRHRFPTGLAFEIPVGWEIQVRPRSGLAARNGLTVLNSPSTVDAGYVGEVSVVLVNHGHAAVRIEQGDRIAQLVPSRVDAVVFAETTERFDDTERGTDGFGSSGLGGGI